MLAVCLAAAFGVLAPAAAADTVTSVSAGTHSTCALLSGGTVQCWGADGSGQLGDGAPGPQRLTPVTVPGVSGATAVTVGGDHACALIGSGSVTCWGSDAHGQLGDGQPPASVKGPVTVSGLKGPITALSAGTDFTCALDSTGARCWGNDASGQLGDGQTTDSSAPVSVGLTLTGTPSPTPTAITAGADHACALLSDGTVQCWGSDAQGQLGDGKTVSPKGPVAVTGLTGATTVAAGTEFSCATTAANVQCWGTDSAGQLGDDRASAQSGVPVTVPITGSPAPASVSAGGDHACAVIKSDGSVRCWGSDAAGQLGDGQTVAEAGPVAVAGLTGITAVTVGADHSCADLPANGVDCWGANADGQLGTGGEAASAVPAGLEQSLTVTLAGRGTGNVSLAPSGTCAGTTCLYPHGSSVSVTAAAATDNGFAGYSGAGCGTGASCPVALVDPQTVTATFTAPPGIVIGAPAPTDYPEIAVPAARFSCPAVDGPTPACTATNDGRSISPGQKLQAGIGSHTFTVTAADSAGGRATQTVRYTVSAKPAASIDSPPQGDPDYAPSAVPTAQFSCTPDPNSPLKSGIQGCSGSADGGAAFASGHGLPGGVGSHTLTVTATARDGQTTTASSTYTVSAPPAISVTSPVANANYQWQSVPAAGFACTAASHTSLTGCVATVDNRAIGIGQALPNSLGEHTMAITATDADGQKTSQSLTYTASFTFPALSSVSILAPVQDGRYRLGQTVNAKYSCYDNPSASPLKSCVGTTDAGRPIDTRTLGRHTFEVTATDADGQSASLSVTYRVVPTTNRFTLRRVVPRRGRLTVTLRLPGPGRLAVVVTGGPGGGVCARVRARASHPGLMRLTLSPAALRRVAGAVRLTITYTPTGGTPRRMRSRPIRVP